MRAGLGALFREIGLLRGSLVTLGVGWRMLRGAPFRALKGASRDALEPSEGHRARERENRAQVGSVINIYQALRGHFSEEEAIRVTGAVVTAGGRAFLKRTLRELNDTDALLAMSEAERSQYLKRLLSPIPNALFELSIDDQGQVHYTVTSCRFAELCKLLGYPELGPLFCAVDDHFFREDTPHIHLERSTTLARGGDHCPFVLSLAPRDPQELVQIEPERPRAQ